MPKPGMRWRHITLGTHNSWLPGDPRGFCAKDHKLHSSGDYKNPPPAGEHAGLHRYAKLISASPVIIPRELRPVVGANILSKLREYQVLALAVGGMHVHLQAELPDDLPTIRRIMGNWKRAASHAIRDTMPGRVWGRDGGFKAILDKAHQARVYRYILQQRGAWVWSYKDGYPD